MQEIFGDSASPFTDPPKRLTLVFAEQSNAGALSRLVKAQVVLPKAVIDDAADGEYYTLANVRAVQYRTQLLGTQSSPHPMVTFTVGTAHGRCGPPTCLKPTHDSTVVRAGSDGDIRADLRGHI